MKFTGTIYKIENKKTGQLYFGKTVKKWSLYVGIYYRACKGKIQKGSEKRYIMRSLKKHGRDAFRFKIVKTIKSDSKADLNTKLCDLEKFYIAKHNTNLHRGFRLPNGKTHYNHTDGGEGMCGLQHSEYTKQKIRNSLLGFNHSDETKKKMSNARKGNNNNMYGKTHTEAAKQKVSDANTGNVWSESRKMLWRDENPNNKAVVYRPKNDKNAQWKMAVSASAAAREVDGDASCVSKVCRGHPKRKSHKGFIFKYAS